MVSCRRVSVISGGVGHLERWPVAQLCEQNAKDAAGADKSLGRGRRQHVDQARRRARIGRRVGFQGPATSSHHRQGWGGGSWRRGKIAMLRHRLWMKWLLLLRWRLQRLQQIVRWRRWRQLLLWRRLWRRVQRLKTKDASQQLGHVPVGIAAQWPLPLRRCQRLRRVHAKTAAVHSAKRQDGRHAYSQMESASSSLGRCAGRDRGGGKHLGQQEKAASVRSSHSLHPRSPRHGQLGWRLSTCERWQGPAAPAVFHHSSGPASRRLGRWVPSTRWGKGGGVEAHGRRGAH